MEWIETGQGSAGFWDRFGEGLAEMHRHQEERFGFEADNFIGRLPQQNAWHAGWVDFFRYERLLPQIERARTAGIWQHGWDRYAAGILQGLENWLPASPDASVLHGDLWSGNFLRTATGAAALIDPAAYFGHRETDLALTELFGGFDRAFYAAYHSAWPLEPGYEARRDLYNLYHLVNHLNHFGGSYAASVAEVLRRYGR
jgi:protein-ribulosamine 3-kinase